MTTEACLTAGLGWHGEAGMRVKGHASRLFAMVFALTCLIAALAGAAEPAADDVAAQQAVAVLQKIQAAARTLDYAGVYTYQQGQAMMSSRIVHMVDGTGERERIELLDGEPREYVRYNDESHCLIPSKKVVLVEDRRGDRFPGLLLGDSSNLSTFYQIHTSGSHYRVAGRECQFIELVPRDNARYGYRLCADTETHLLLKVQVMGSHGMIDQTAFNTLSLGEHVSPEGLETGLKTDGWKVVQSAMTPVDLSKKGWRIPYPPGYQPVMQAVRTMKHGRQVSQLVLADGLAAVSIFIEPLGPEKGLRNANEVASTGAMNIFSTRVGDHWLTALGEVPAQTLRELAERTEYVPPAPTLNN